MEKIQGAVKAIMKVVNKTMYAYQDKKITRGEFIGIAVTAMGIIGLVLKGNLSQIVDEVKQFNITTDLPVLVSEISNDIDIPDKVLQEKILNTLKMINDILAGM